MVYNLKEALNNILINIIRIVGDNMGYNRMDISDNLSNILQKKSIGIEEFSKLMGITLKDAGRVLDGRVILSSDNIAKVVKNLNIDEKELYSECNRVHYRHEFKHEKNRNEILRIINAFINLKEK